MLSHIYSLQPSVNPCSFQMRKWSQRQGGLLGAAVQGLQRVGRGLSDSRHDMTQHGVKEYCTGFQLPGSAVFGVSFLQRRCQTKKSRNEWSRERGSFSVCCLLASHEAHCYQQGSHAQYPKGMSVTQKKPHEQKTSTTDEFSLVFAMESSLHTSQDHGGSWEYGQHWSPQANCKELCGAYRPPQSRVQQCDPLEEKTDWNFLGTI